SASAQTTESMCSPTGCRQPAASSADESNSSMAPRGAAQRDMAFLLNATLWVVSAGATVRRHGFSGHGPYDERRGKAEGPGEMASYLIYGANGYTGALTARMAVARGHRPTLAGRSAEAVRALAGELGLEARVFGLDDPARVAEGLAGMTAVLHCAGP